VKFYFETKEGEAVFETWVIKDSELSVEKEFDPSWTLVKVRGGSDFFPLRRIFPPKEFLT
jgi:hypothetical protein